MTNKHVLDIAWSPDGEFIIAGSTDNTATIWKASTGELNGHSGACLDPS